jgi:hypothetical protein
MPMAFLRIVSTPAKTSNQHMPAKKPADHQYKTDTSPMRNRSCDDELPFPDMACSTRTKQGFLWTQPLRSLTV